MSSSEQASHTTYADAYRESMDQPEKFWLDAARAVDWDVAPTKALDDSAAPIYRWFPDASLNTSFNALDRHVRDGRGDQTALIFDSAMVPTKATYTYAELLEQVSLFAGVLKDQGVVAGDRVIIYMPMIPRLRSRCSRVRESALCIRWCSAALRPRSSQPVSTTPVQWCS